jgi:hypothetical protein
MNTATETPQPEPEAAPATRKPDLPRWQRRNLSPVRGLVFLGVSAVMLMAALLNIEAVWHLVAETVILCLEVAEELMDTLLEVVGMAPGTAQMATAYIGVLVFLVLLYFLARRSVGWTRRIGETLADYRDMYLHLLRTGSVDARERLIAWWKGLDWLTKIAAVAFTVLVLIPLFLGLSVGLGMLVAMLI